MMSADGARAAPGQERLNKQEHLDRQESVDKQERLDEEALTAEAALRVQAWLSPAYPIGAFSFSGGLEAAAAEGLAPGAPDLAAWIETSLVQGPGWSDAVFLAAAWRATRAGDRAALAEAAALAAAFAPGRERLLETKALGAAFVKISAAAYPWPAPTDPSAPSSGSPFSAAPFSPAEAAAALGPEPAYPIALGAWAAAFETPLRPLLALFLHSLAANLISAGIRLSLTGQSEGQTMAAAMIPLVQATAARAASAPLDAVGGAFWTGDIAGLRHETLPVRLFRT